MYEDYTHQSLPKKEYRELLGTANYVFNSNNAFIIENILRNDDDSQYNWHNLTDKTSGQLKDAVKNTITKASNDEIANLFDSVVDKRNRIIHGLPITDKDGEQILSTKDKNNKQYIITEEFLKDFIQENDQLNNILHKFRGY